MLYLLDTCSYLRLAYSIHPLLGTGFYPAPELAVVTSDVHYEWAKQPRLRTKFHWAGEERFVLNRDQNQINVTSAQSSKISKMLTNIKTHASRREDAINAARCKIPSHEDCSVLAHTFVFSSTGISTIAVSDDKGMGWVANDLNIPFITTLDLVKRMVDARTQTVANVKAIAGYLNYELDLPPDWKSRGLSLFGVQLP